MASFKFNGTDLTKVTFNGVEVYPNTTLNYFYVHDLSASSNYIRIYAYNSAVSNVALWYSTDKINWTLCNITSSGSYYEVPIAANGYVYFKGNHSNSSLSTSTSNYVSFKSCNGNIEVGGNIMSLTDENMTSTTAGGYCFYNLFSRNTNLVYADKLELPATTLNSWCYYQMFYGCTGLLTTPSLLASTVTTGSYSCMFYGCTSLTTAPDLPATSIGSGSYAKMFEGCTSLTNLPNVASNTYQYSMFSRCLSLPYILHIPSNILYIDDYCFDQNTQLEQVIFDQTSAITLGNSCFYKCSLLNTVDFLAMGSNFKSCTFGTSVWTSCQLRHCRVTQSNFGSTLTTYTRSYNDGLTTHYCYIRSPYSTSNTYFTVSSTNLGLWPVTVEFCRRYWSGEGTTLADQDYTTFQVDRTTGAQPISYGIVDWNKTNGGLACYSYYTNKGSTGNCTSTGVAYMAFGLGSAASYKFVEMMRAGDYAFTGISNSPTASPTTSTYIYDIANDATAFASHWSNWGKWDSSGCTWGNMNLFCYPAYVDQWIPIAQADGGWTTLSTGTSVYIDETVMGDYFYNSSSPTWLDVITGNTSQTFRVSGTFSGLGYSNSFTNIEVDIDRISAISTSWSTGTCNLELKRVGQSLKVVGCYFWIDTGTEFIEFSPGTVQFTKIEQWASSDSSSGGSSSAGGATGGCFTFDTPILMADGTTKPIYQIQSGDEIKSYDYKDSGQITSKKVLAVTHLTGSYVRANIMLEDGTLIRTTDTHPFLSVGGWKSLNPEHAYKDIILEDPICPGVSLLEVGDYLITENGTIKVVQINSRFEPNTDVYNLDIEDYDTFFANGVVVHNIATK